MEERRPLPGVDGETDALWRIIGSFLPRINTDMQQASDTTVYGGLWVYSERLRSIIRALETIADDMEKACEAEEGCDVSTLATKDTSKGNK